MKLLNFLNSDPIDLYLNTATNNNKTSSMMENQMDEEFELDEVYPGQSSGKLKNWVHSHLGGKITCTKASQIKGNSDAPKHIKNRASWYQSLHCKGKKQVREGEPSEGAALTIFDIDDTLFKTDASVYVKNQNGDKKKLTSQEFNSHKLGNNEAYDFNEFKDAKRFHATSTPIENIWNTARNTLENVGKRPGSRVVIVTARSDLDNKDLFLDTFRKHGLDMDKVHVYRAGNIQHGNSADKKKIVIRNLLEDSGFTEVRLFDDHQENLAAFLELSNEFPGVVFKAFPVSKTGNIATPIVLSGDIES